MLTLGGAINLQQQRLAGIQKETAVALAELGVIKEQVADQRRAKNEAYNEQQNILDVVQTLEKLVASLIDTSEHLKNNVNQEVSELSKKHDALREEIDKKIQILKDKNKKIEEISGLDEEIIAKKAEINAEIARFREESDQIDAKRTQLIKDEAKIEKARQEALKIQELNKNEKQSIENRINELREIENIYGGLLPKN